ncbi:hypothetical protein NHQ30_000994 [Ciborinia camelliae]|nr:hypothetical protein NHQ30_000994 [Ciborinia camelliae]
MHLISLLAAVILPLALAAPVPADPLIPVTTGPLNINGDLPVTFTLPVNVKRQLEEVTSLVSSLPVVGSAVSSALAATGGVTGSGTASGSASGLLSGLLSGSASGTASGLLGGLKEKAKRQEVNFLDLLKARLAGVDVKALLANLVTSAGIPILVPDISGITNLRAAVPKSSQEAAASSKK